MNAALMVPSPIIDAALAVLADGKARSADEILALAIKEKVLPATTSRKSIYTALSQYVERSMGRGRKPQIVEDEQHRFRLNRPLDDWPDIDLTGLPPLAPPSLSADAQQALTQLQTAANGTDPTAFEIAACNALSALGFVTTHVGGNGQPDGYADAPLGPMAYRIMIECKLSADIGDSHSAAAAEAAKFKQTYGGSRCMLVAPSYQGEVTFADELQTHDVSAWTVDDIAMALRWRCDPIEMLSLLDAGFAQDVLGDFTWNRIHGRAKRLRVISSIVLREASRQQHLDVSLHDGAAAAHFTIDVAIGVVDTYLGAAGATSGCLREDVEAAFEWLTNPIVRRAAWLDASKNAIVVVP